MASATLAGIFFMRLLGLGEFRVLREARDASTGFGGVIHQCAAAFGLVSGSLGSKKQAL